MMIIAYLVMREKHERGIKIMAVTAVNGTGTQTDVTIARKYHKKGTNTYYLYDSQGNRYKVGQGIYNKAIIGGTINSSQLPLNKKVTFQTPVSTNPASLSQELETAQNQLRTMQQQFTGNAGYGEWLNSRIGQPVAQEYASPFSASLSNTQPKAIAQWNGKITYNGIEYPNLAEFRRFNPEVQIQPLTPVTSVAPSVTAPIESSPSLTGRSVEDIQQQQRALFMEEQGTPKVTMQKIKDGPNKGKFGVFVNGKLQENQVFDSKNQASKARIEIEKKVNDFDLKYDRRLDQRAESESLRKSRYGAKTEFNPETGLWESTNKSRAGWARVRDSFRVTEAEMDALQPYQRGLKTKPQVIETPIIIEQPVVPEGQKPAGSTIEFNAEPAPNAPRPNTGEAEGLGRIVAEDAGAGAKAGAEAGAKSMTEAGSKNFFKSGKGKAALVLGGLALVGATLFGLSKCSDDKKQQLPPVEPEKKPEPKPEPQKTVAPVQPKKPEENKNQQPQFEEISVVKGSDEWKYAELELIAEHLGQAGYRPSNQEITDRMMQIIEREKKALEEAKANDPEGKNRHSIPTLNESDMLKVSPELKKLIDEATNELKEAHKDNPNYKVTWTELRAKVQEKLNA